jgi:DNA-binding SARP family transcriptional activator
MLRLVTFGGLAVERDSCALHGVASRPRLMALLALAAASRDRGISRDQVLAYLWPERDTPHARNCLKQTVFAVRHHLGRNLLESSATGFRLNPSLISADIWEFETAHARGAHELAVHLYRGPFLNGFHIPSLSEFDQWIERERLRRVMHCRASLELLAQRAAADTDWTAAVTWFRQLTVLEPLSSRAALGLMRALVASGDCTEALEYNRIYMATVRRELDSPPDPAVTAYATWLRNSSLGQHDRRRRPRVRIAAPR